MDGLPVPDVVRPEVVRLAAVEDRQPGSSPNLPAAKAQQEARIRLNPSTQACGDLAHALEGDTRGAFYFR